MLPPTNLLPRSELLFHLPLINILDIFKDFSSTTRKNSKTNHQHPKIFKDFLSANLSQLQIIDIPEIFKNFPSSSSISAATSNHPASSIPAATSNSDQQQQQAAATSSSNQQQRSTASISSNQQQQSPSATSSGSQHSSYQQHLHNQRRHLLVITTVPSRRYPASS